MPDALLPDLLWHELPTPHLNSQLPDAEGTRCSLAGVLVQAQLGLVSLHQVQLLQGGLLVDPWTLGPEVFARRSHNTPPQTSMPASSSIGFRPSCLVFSCILLFGRSLCILRGGTTTLEEMQREVNEEWPCLVEGSACPKTSSLGLAELPHASSLPAAALTALHSHWKTLQYLPEYARLMSAEHGLLPCLSLSSMVCLEHAQ